MDLHSTLTNLLALTTTEVDPSAAFRAVREHFAARLPDCAFALLHVQHDGIRRRRLEGRRLEMRRHSDQQYRRSFPGGRRHAGGGEIIAPLA